MIHRRDPYKADISCFNSYHTAREDSELELVAMALHEKRSEDASHSLSIPPAHECTYTMCYCEENVWMLCDHVRKTLPHELERCFCVFISNENRSIPLWRQKSSTQQDRLVVWDYHVILLWRGRTGTLVYDLDTELPFPCDFELYMKEGVKSNRTLRPDFHRKFRVVPAAEFLATFASDRSHMLREDGTWKMPPPSYPCLRTPDCSNNIQEFISMDTSVEHGRVHTEEEFVNFFMQL